MMEQVTTSRPGLPHPESAPRSSMLARAARLLLAPRVILLLGVALVVSRGITTGELHFYIDETRHAMNGVFFRDLLVDLPLSNPLQYAREYYAKYPAIALPHWPPFFPFIEGIFFLLFGISVWASRLAMLSFALLGVYFWYGIAERQGPRDRALLSAFIFPLLPAVLLYERVTMLEIPQVSLSLGAIYFWLRWLESERARDVWALAAFSVAGLLTSQRAIFLVFFLGLHFLMERRYRLLRRWDVWAALAASLAVVLPWYALSFRTVTLSYERAVGREFTHMLSGEHLYYYFTVLPQQLGLVLLCLTLVGFGWAVFRSARYHRFFLLWVVSCYVFFTLVQEKEPRHIMMWIPPLVYFALLGVEVLFVRKRWALVASTALGLYFLIGALRFERPKITGMEEVARYVLSQPGSDVMYYQGSLNGNFIFFVRKFDPEKRHMVVRGKQVVVSNIVYDQRQVLRTTDEVLNFFRTWGIRYAVIEDEPLSGGLELVDGLLRSEQFELLRFFPLWSNDPRLDGRKVRVYRYRGEVHRTDQPVTIPMMTIRSSIHVDLKRLVGRPWPN